MNQQQQFEMALGFALKTYAGKKRSRGLPYITHPLEVMSNGNLHSIIEKITALFHDYGEFAEPATLYEYEIAEEVITTIRLLAKSFPDDIPEADPRYEQYFWDILPNPLARVVKYADLSSNNGFEESPVEYAKHVSGEYHRTVRVLEDAVLERRIYFFSQTIFFNIFSNFFVSELEIDGNSWRSVEQYYQAQKFSTDSIPFAKICSARSGKEAKALADMYREAVLSSWTEDRKVRVMRKALAVKFAPGTAMAYRLRMTGELELVHESNDDFFWGKSRRNEGENILGRLLMEIRRGL